MSPTVGSLFTGIGGFDKGLERAGFDVAWQCDNDPFCNKVLAHHWPGVKRYDDVRRIGGCGDAADDDLRQDGGQRAVGSIQPRRGSVDLICGGFPCQDLSVAGKRAGLDGGRSGLWFEFKRILSELRPTWAIIENVPGLLSSNQGRDFAVVLDGLGECGFGGIAWAVLDSQHFGVAQRRRRVYVVAGPTSRSVEQVLSLCEGCGGYPAPRRTPGEDVAGTLSAGAHPFGFNGQDGDTYVADTLRVGSNSIHGNYGESVLAHSLRADGFDASEDGTGRGTPIVAFAENQRGELRLSGISPQLTTGGGKPGQGYSATIDRASVRRLTPTECERLQHFPDGWTCICGANGGDGCKCSDGPRYKALGNAVTTSVIQYLGERIQAVLS